MLKATWKVLLLIAALGPGKSWAAGDTAFTEFGDVVQILLPVGAFGTTYLYDDREGRIQFIKSLGTSTLTVHTIKWVAAKHRPGQEGNTTSFPSGHTQAAFSGAAFFQTRYGYKWGIPAYTLATLVGLSRIQAEKHFADDVIAGAGIAMLSNWYFTTPYSESVAILPSFGKDHIGITAFARW